MSRQVTRTETLTLEVRTQIQELYFGNDMLFWRNCLADKMSRYQFETAMAGRQVSGTVVSDVIAAVDEDVKRVWKLLRLEFDGKDVVRLVKERYTD